MLGRSWVTSDRVGRRGFGAAHGVPYGVGRDRLRSGGRLLDWLLGRSVRGEWLGRLPSDGCGLVLDGRGLLLHRRRRLLLDRGRLLLDRDEGSTASATGWVKRAASAASRRIGSGCGLRGAASAAGRIERGRGLGGTSATSATSATSSRRGRLLLRVTAASSRSLALGRGSATSASATSGSATSARRVLRGRSLSEVGRLGSRFCAKEEAEGEYRDQRRSQHQHELAARRDRPRAATATRVGKVVVAVFAQLYAASLPFSPR
jgi:hypothetical protein